MKLRSMPVRLTRALLLGTLLGVASSPAIALDPSLPPSGNFDLTKWNITLPVDGSGGFSGTPLTILPSQLSAGYAYAPYFYTGADGAMVFGVPYNGAAGGTSSHPRSELRESNPDDTLRNWKPGDYSGTHIMDAICVVEDVGDGKVSLGQIHGKEPNVPAIILRFDNTVSPARVYCTVKRNPSSLSSQDTLYFTNNIAVGEPITYRLRIDGSATSCLFSVTVNGVTQTIDMYANNSDWADVTFYYKAGAYYTNPDDGETAVVSFYHLNVSHDGDGPAITTATLPNAQLGVAYSQSLAASGGTTPYTWSLVGGALPSGVSLNSAGLISGTPSATGTFNFTAQVSDAASATATRALSLTVEAAATQVATPVFSPAGGTYTAPQSVALSTATSGAQIRYTIDGTTPSPTYGTLYTGPGTVGASMTIKAIAYKSGLLDSAIATATYTITSGNVVPAIVEAEAATVDSGYWSLVTDSGASGGQALRALVSSTGSPPAGGGAVYTFTLSSAATVYFHAKGLAGNASANEVWVRVNNGSWTNLNFTWLGSGYKWKRTSASLAAGTHTFEIRCCEANTQIDQVAATLSSSDPN
ncbi:MAG: polysaccharide lyase family 7 protein [Candidatus Didemnitutus sp.]|nr:polysaccharide lyase family 7 protein [Candidatus Didemnitutus sp.]